MIGILRVMFDARITLQSQVSEQLKAHFGDKVFDTVIPRNVRLAEAPSYGMPGVVFDPAFERRAGIPRLRARDGGARRRPARRARRLSTKAEIESARFDEALLARIEDAGINASAPREQRWVDGWLLRLSPGKAKRARCIQAVAPGRLGHRRQAGALPAALRGGGTSTLRADHAVLAAARARPPSRRPRAWSGSTTRGSWSSHRSPSSPRLPARRVPVQRSRAPTRRAFADWVGAPRGSSAVERHAHAERICPTRRAAPRRARARAPNGEIVAGGLVVIEGEVAGLYDVFTAEAERGRGHARSALPPSARVRREPRRDAWATCRSTPRNEAARRIYRRLGFADAYAYHYRTPPAAPERRAARRALDEPGGLVEAQVHVHRLHRGAARALAEVVEPAHQQHLGRRCANTNRSTRLVSLHACTSK